MKLPLSIVVAALGVAAGGGGTLAIARQAQSETTERVAALETESQANRDRVLRIEILSQQVAKTVERIERKLDK